MPAKVTGAATDYREVDRWEDGVGRIAHPEEIMRRASHAFATDEGVWVIDPVDAAGVDDLLAEFGAVAGVVVLSNYHRRDAGTVARRHGVAVHLPAPIADAGLGDGLDAPADTLGDLDPERVLSGHGAGVHEDAAEALAAVLANARQRYPRALLENGLRQARTVLAAART